MRLVIIALRNLGRQRRRTLLSMLVIASGAAALVLTLAFMRHSFTGLRDAIIFGGLGHMAVMPASTGEAGDALAESPSLRGWEPLRAQIAGLGGMRAVGARAWRCPGSRRTGTARRLR